MTLVRVPVPWKGVDLSSEPDTLVAGQGTLLRNVLPGRQGQLVPRGPLITAVATLTTDKDTADYGGGGFWVYTSFFLQNAGSTGQVSRSGAAAFATPAGAGYITASHAPLKLYTVGCTGGANRNLMTWDGSVGAGLVLVTNGPIGVDAVVTHLNRVFALAQGELRWTIPDPDLTTNLAATWQDPVTGLTNKILLPPGETYVDLLTFNRALYIIGSRAVYALLGDTPSAFVLRKVLDVGAGSVATDSAAGAAAATSKSMYFRSQNGLLAFDGVTSRVVSHDVMLSGSSRVTGSQWTHVTPIMDDYVSVITTGNWWLLHEPTGAWTRLTSTLFPISRLHGNIGGLPTLVRRVGNEWFAVSPGDPIGPTPGVACRVRLNPEDAVASVVSLGPNEWKDNKTNVIDAQAVSASIRLSGPDRMANLQRLYAQAGAGGWTVQVEDEAGTVIGSPASLVTGTKRARAEADALQEIDIVRVRWTWDGVGLATRVPSIADAYLMTDAAQQR